jgi:hypothetical protein
MDLNQAREIARKMVRAYPYTPEDRTDDGECIGDGYYSLAKKIKIRVEYANRGNLLVRLRQGRCTKPAADTEPDPSSENSHVQETSPATVRTVNAYGCVDWQPLELPENETEETLVGKQAHLQKITDELGPRNDSCIAVPED